MIRDIAPGQDVTLDLAGLEGWKARVDAVVTGRVALSSTVRLPGDPAALAGAPGQVAFVTPRGVLRVSGVVLSADPSGRLEVAVADDVEIDQRREHVRTPASLPALIDRPAGGHPPLHTYTLDISGGGLLVAGVGPAEAGDAVHVTLKLPGRDPLRTAAVIGHRTREGRVALIFDGIDPAEREQLVRFVFERQRLDRQAAQERR